MLVIFKTFASKGFLYKKTCGYAPTTNANKKLYNAGSEWQDDIEGLADYYSTFFREYDPVIGRFNSVDPISTNFESWTTYQYSYNNPVNFNDPMGDFASMQSEYTLWHNSRYGDNSSRSISERFGAMLGLESFDGGGGGGGDIRFSNAKELFEYVQKMGTNSINTSAGGLYADAFGVYDMSYFEVSEAWSNSRELGITQGREKNETPVVRKDGSRMFKKENEAYQWMQSQSLANNNREEFAIVLSNSVLVLPDYKNTGSEVIPEDYGYKWIKGKLFDPVTERLFDFVFTIHTHLSKGGYDPDPSFADQKYFARNTPNKPYLTMGNNGRIYGNYGRWSVGSDGIYHTKDIKTYQISFTRGNSPITNFTIGTNFPLRDYLLNYMKTYFR